jgi:metallo-beta-lactamase family protein
MQIRFLGAAGEVTGSCFLVESANRRFLVDCGMFQGGREADAKNRASFTFDPGAIDFVLLTHAHLDHSGLLPRLAASGFSKPVYATAATRDLLEVMLADSAFIQEREFEWRRNAGRNGEPLYTLKQVHQAMALVRVVAYDEFFTPAPDVRCRYRDAGHILGSAFIETWCTEASRSSKIVFSGDIGQPGHPIVKNPEHIDAAEVLLIESTYGNRAHKTMEQTIEEFVHAVTDTIARKQGNVIIPAFAVGRTQDLLFLIVKLYRQKRLPDLQVYVDSPMATAATEVTLKHMELVDEEAVEAMQWIRSSGTRPSIRFVQDPEESRALNRITSGALIISASGMCDAGRIKHHLRHNLARPECSVIFTGFQAAGTLGRRIVERSPIVRIHGEEVAVKADIYTIGGLSAHADQAGLLDWLGQIRESPRQTFVVHGEIDTAREFAAVVEARLGWKTAVPALGQAFPV